MHLGTVILAILVGFGVLLYLWGVLYNCLYEGGTGRPAKHRGFRIFLEILGLFF